MQNKTRWQCNSSYIAPCDVAMYFAQNITEACRKGSCRTRTGATIFNSKMAMKTSGPKEGSVKVPKKWSSTGDIML